MYYYALFLSGGTYIEKCLALIKYINNPHSKSLPHITLRLFQDIKGRLENIRHTNVASLNIIGPSTFNMDGSAQNPVVFLQCESKELEFWEHKPDYPLSRLHLTLYEGADFDYAQAFYKLLTSIEWRFELVFSVPLHLSEEKLGQKIANEFNLKATFEEIVGECFEEFQEHQYEAENRLRVINIILKQLNHYNHSHGIRRVDSLYSDVRKIDNSKSFIDESHHKIITSDADPEKNAAEMAKLAQNAIYITPPEYAEDMARCALDAFSNDQIPINFGDSAIGTGTLFLALQHLIDEVNVTKGKKYKIHSAVGIDNDRTMAREAFVKCSKRGLTVIYGDALSPSVDLGSKRNLMIVNPPYNRHHDIPEDYRKQGKQLAQKQTGIKVSGNAGLHVYHMLIMDKWLEDGGIAVWLIPSMSLQTRYGEAIRDYLLNCVQLLRLHIYDERELQFENTMISTAIVVFRKSTDHGAQKVAVSHGYSLEEPHYIDINLLRDKTRDWRRTVIHPDIDISCKNVGFDDLSFDMLFNIKRGLATGANSFFILERDRARSCGIPDCALRPILPKARFLESLIVTTEDDGFPKVTPQLVLIDCDLPWEEIRQKHPEFYQYLESARAQGITARTLVRSRSPWYKQERREAAPFLLTYMGRNKKNLPPLYFILNKSKAVASNTYILLYPKPWLKEVLESDKSLYEALLISLNVSAKYIIEQRTRVYSGGLQKLEPNELKTLPVIDIPRAISLKYRQVK